jgi:AraC-like DNA-binding protein
LAAGKILRSPIEIFLHPHLFGEGIDDRVHLLPRDAAVLKPEGDVIADGGPHELVIGVLKDETHPGTKPGKALLVEGLPKEEDLSIMEIAGMFGYENCSKFAAAFRGEFGASPSSYRKQHKE